MRLLASILMPLVRLLSASSGGLLKIFGVPTTRAQPVSEEEIKVMIDEGIEHGMFEEAERDMIEGVFELGDARVNELMTPRTDIAWLDIEDTREETSRRIRESGLLALPRLPRGPGHGARRRAGEGHPRLLPPRRGVRPARAGCARPCTCPRTRWR